MSSNEYLKLELNSFIAEFSQTRVRYEFDILSGTHFIEIVPKETYYLDSNYIKWESSMFDRFIELYPSELICFISDDALVGLVNIDYELIGKDFTSSFNINPGTITLQEKSINVTTKITSEGPINISSCCEVCIPSDYEKPLNIPLDYNQKYNDNYALAA
jgi:hypothetical protein